MRRILSLIAVVALMVAFAMPVVTADATTPPVSPPAQTLALRETSRLSVAPAPLSRQGTDQGVYAWRPGCWGSPTRSPRWSWGARGSTDVA
jgi:hypothetical protein